jgi:TM2 domain-containing membrane protein YozV
MNAKVHHEDRYANIEIDLKNPVIAAVLAWLWPGAGHLYQRRIGKGLLYMVCILVTFYWGLAMGDGHVVYASFSKPDIRYPYIFQIGVGLPAFPAIAQKAAADNGHRIFDSHYMAPPRGEKREQQHDELATWHEQLGFYFELGTLYTMIAGLLNMLVIYDAYAGPVFADPQGTVGESPPDKSSKQK